MKRALVISVILLFVFSCQKFKSPDPKNLVSTHDEDESHNNGQNCMNCHYSAGYAEGFFTVAGSIYGEFKNSVIKLYKDKQGSPIKTIEVDQLGNTYTTEAVDFQGGLFVEVVSARGKREWMDDKIFNGQCNLCHGTSIEDKIEID